MEPEEFVRLCAGELCPCGHDKDEHAEPMDEEIVPGLREVMGACTKCNCAGVVEPETFHDGCF